jgi:diacylglycerol kinase family enzyme
MATAATASPPTLQARPRLRRLAAVVNPASGCVGPGAAVALAEQVAAYGYDLSLSTPHPNEIEASLRAAVAAAPDLILVLAGDGTARLAAELCGPDGPLVAPLPGGTLNMLAHALYGPRPWPAALAAALEIGVERDVSGGRVGGRAFHVAAILGAPALLAHAREAVRAGRLLEAGRRVGHALRRAFGGELHYALEGAAEYRTEALVLIAPMISTMMRHEAALEAASLDVRSAQEAFRLAFNGLTGGWRHDPSVTLEMFARGRAWARGRIPCILDGEIHPMPRAVEIKFVPRGFRALAPAEKGT